MSNQQAELIECCNRIIDWFLNHPEVKVMGEDRGKTQDMLNWLRGEIEDNDETPTN